MTIELRSIHEYPESDGWMIHWKSQSLQTACESAPASRPQSLAALSELSRPLTAVSQRILFTDEFHVDRWRLVGKEWSKRSCLVSSRRDRPVPTRNAEETGESAPATLNV